MQIINGVLGRLGSTLGGYQFEADPSGSGRSIVTEIKKTPSGLVMPTFNRELADLTDQALDLELPEGEA